ncbi:MAG: hypothetical protein B6D55_08685 [Candidatus Omnitrophica bacterium 4484_70.2]|nr:MAG: hypothetical protein B6D55_08685 [Candidatus Omnitrophica bacterium 4484_70.2]
MRKEKVYLLDVDYKNIGGGTKIVLYGRNKKREKIAIIDPHYQPYFYVLPSNLEKAKKEIEEILKKSNFKVERIEKTRKIWRNTCDFLKITCRFAQEVYKIRDLIKKLEVKRGGSGSVIDEFEYQLSFPRGYLADKEISGVDCIEVEGEEIEKKNIFDVDIVLEAERIKRTEEVPSYKILSFDIEVVEEKGERKIVMISLYGENLKKVLTYKKASFPSFVEVFRDEKEILNKFIETIKDYDPDIIVGYNSDGYDFEVIRERANKLRINLDSLSWDKSGIIFSKRARTSTARLKGRVHIDIFNFVNNILSPILQTEVLSLDAVASEILGDKKIQMEYQDILEAWQKNKDLEKLASYCLKDSQLTFRLAEILLPQILELTRIVGQSIFDTSRMMYSQLVEWFYTKWAKKTNRIVPNQPKFDEILKRQKETFLGGYVKEPQVGIHENIAVVDFASLYPSIISTYNVSLETLKCDCAQAITWWGRFWIKRIMEEAEKQGFSVIYGDTDSAFLGLDKKNKEELFSFLKEMNKKLPGIMRNAIEEAVKLVREKIKALKELKISLRDLAVYEQITKPLSDYKLISPHVAAAKRLEEQGIPVGEGTVVGFVIKKGLGSISEKAYPVEFINLEDVDKDYYIHHQILPASLRILKVLGIKESDILN